MRTSSEKACDACVVAILETAAMLFALFMLPVLVGGGYPKVHG